MTSAFKKTAATVLAALTLLPFAACSDSDIASSVTTSAQTAAADSDTASSAVTCSVPAGTDLGGEAINIWYFTKNSDAAESFIDIQGSLDGDVVNEALYNRNLAAEEALNADLVFTDTGVASSDVGGEIAKMVLAGSSDYDIFNVVQWNSCANVTQGIYMDLSSLPCVRLDEPWWAKSYIEECSAGSGSYYFLCGDISVDLIRCISCMYFNKPIYENYWGSADGIYQEVLDGKWTLDELRTKATAAYSDLDGDTKASDADQYGLFLNSYNNVDTMYFDAGLHLVSRDASGTPYLSADNPTSISFFSDFYDLCKSTTGVKQRDGDKGTVNNNTAFGAGRGLFLSGFLYTSEALRDMEQDYGIIPAPKYTEDIENYAACVHDIATLVCLPATCTKVEDCGKVLEYLAYQSYLTVTPAYYETAMKTKYTRDQLSAQIIDLLHGCITTDFAYVFENSFSGFGCPDWFFSSYKKFESYYAKNEAKLNESLQKLITAFSALN